MRIIIRVCYTYTASYLTIHNTCVYWYWSIGNEIGTGCTQMFDDDIDERRILH